MVTLVQDQVHGMGVSLDWDKYYPDGEDTFKPMKPAKLPVPEARRQGVYTEDGEARTTTTTTEKPEIPWKYRSVVEWVQRTKGTYPKMVYHTEHGVWTTPSYFDQS